MAILFFSLFVIILSCRKTQTAIFTSTLSNNGDPHPTGYITDDVWFITNSDSIVYIREETDDRYIDTIEHIFDTLNVDWDTLHSLMGSTSLSFNDLNTDVLYHSNLDTFSAIALTAIYGQSIGNPDSISYAITVFSRDGGNSYENPMLIKTKKGDYIRLIDLQSEIVTTIVYDSYTDDVTTTVATHEFRSGSSSGCGQAVMNCITDAYSNHGWASVWLFVQSIFIPSTGAAIATVCFVKNCLGN